MYQAKGKPRYLRTSNTLLISRPTLFNQPTFNYDNYGKIVFVFFGNHLEFLTLIIMQLLYLRIQLKYIHQLRIHILLLHICVIIVSLS